MEGYSPESPATGTDTHETFLAVAAFRDGLPCRLLAEPGLGPGAPARPSPGPVGAECRWRTVGARPTLTRVPRAVVGAPRGRRPRARSESFAERRGLGGPRLRETAREHVQLQPRKGPGSADPPRGPGAFYVTRGAGFPSEVVHSFLNSADVKRRLWREGKSGILQGGLI